MIVAFTGHRPPKAELTYSHEADGDLLAVSRVIAFLKEHDVESVIVGGALGFDTLAARAAWLLHIPYVLYVPFVGQESIWPQAARDRYKAMEDFASHVVVCSLGSYAPSKLQIRNEMMVDASHHLVAYWDGSAGGTRNCMDYAVAWEKPITNIYMPKGA